MAHATARRNGLLEKDSGIAGVCITGGEDRDREKVAWFGMADRFAKNGEAGEWLPIQGQQNIVFLDTGSLHRRAAQIEREGGR